jgi:hypothetical protein
MGILMRLAFAVGVTLLAACNNRGASGPSSNAPTPIGPQRTIFGQVRQVNGGPLVDVTITGRSSHTGQSVGQLASTAADPSFRVDQFAYDDLQFSENGYWQRWWSVPQGARLDATFTFTVKMQPMLRVSPGSTRRDSGRPHVFVQSIGFIGGWDIRTRMPADRIAVRRANA